MSIINSSTADNLAYGYANIRRLKLIGYADSRVTPLTTTDSLITDIETFRDSVGVNIANRPICDAAVDSIRWAVSQDTPLLNTTIVTALTTVDTTTVSATTDLGYNFRGHVDFPTAEGFAAGQSDVTVFQPSA